MSADAENEALKRASDLMSKSDKQIDALLIAVGNELLGGYPRNSAMFQLGHVIVRAGDVIKSQGMHFARLRSARNEALEEAAVLADLFTSPLPDLSHPQSYIYELPLGSQIRNLKTKD